MSNVGLRTSEATERSRQRDLVIYPVRVKCDNSYGGLVRAISPIRRQRVPVMPAGLSDENYLPESLSSHESCIFNSPRGSHFFAHFYSPLHASLTK